MADNNSPWGRPPGGPKPTGGGPLGGGPGGKGPNKENPFEKMLRDGHAKARAALQHDGGEERKWVMVIFALLVGIWFASGIYRVNSDELGIVVRFGAFDRIASPGLNYHLPSPIEQVIIPSVTTVNKVEIGFRAGNAENPNIRVSKKWPWRTAPTAR